MNKENVKTIRKNVPHEFGPWCSRRSRAVWNDNVALVLASFHFRI